MRLIALPGGIALVLLLLAGCTMGGTDGYEDGAGDFGNGECSDGTEISETVAGTCGNGVLEPGESCEEDLDCGDMEICSSCNCEMLAPPAFPK